MYIYILILKIISKKLAFYSLLTGTICNLVLKQNSLLRGGREVVRISGYNLGLNYVLDD